MTTIMLPGINGSDHDHWQSHWERQGPAVVRFKPSDWGNPELTDWMAALDDAVAQAPDPPILVAHSLACLLVAHWAARTGNRVRGAFLVAVPNPSGPAFPSEAASFQNVPKTPLPFPSLIVASSDCPYGPIDYVREQAAAWGSGLVLAGELGHINSASGLGDWAQGAALLDAFRAGIGYYRRDGR